jgi:hypothetical protein
MKLLPRPSYPADDHSHSAHHRPSFRLRFHPLHHFYVRKLAPNLPDVIREEQPPHVFMQDVLLRVAQAD